MLPRSKRLNLKKDFKRIVSGKRVETLYFKLFFKPGLNTTPLIGISLSKKDFKLATERNRARRLASKMVEDIYESLPKGMNLIIMPKAQILNSKSEDLSAELKKCLT